MKKIIAVTRTYIILLLAALVLVVWALVLGSRPVSSDKSPVRVSIARGSTANEIATILDDKGLIRSPLVLKFTCRMSGSSGKLKPGVYEFNRSMSAPEIIKRLVNGESLEVWLTVPEGFTARQIADLLDERQLANGATFVQLAIGRGYEFPRYRFIQGSNLEGYLFPDTYLISRGTDPQAIVDKMLKTFDRKVLLAYKPAIQRAIRQRLGLGRSGFARGLNRVLTMASLVEREAKVPRDRPLIAAVLWNRLDKKMRLEVDATVTYRPGESRENKSKVYYTDLASDSPYNTYKQDGLPPAPICNPGLASIRAALNPAQVDYLYYIAKPDGSHVFSHTLEEHDRAKNALRSAAK